MTLSTHPKRSHLEATDRLAAGQGQAPVTDAQVDATFNRLSRDAATNDAAMGNQVQRETKDLATYIANDENLDAASRRELGQGVATLLPMAGEPGHGDAWNAEMQALANTLSALPAQVPPTVERAADQHPRRAQADASAANPTATGMADSLKQVGGTTTASAGSVDAQAFLTDLESSGGQSMLAGMSSAAKKTIVNAFEQMGGSAVVAALSALGNNSAPSALDQISTPNTGVTATTTPPPQEASTRTTSVDADLTLYPVDGSPSLSDVKQGRTDDCTVDACLLQLIERSPATIKNMLGPQAADGGYDVTLYPNGVKTSVHVTAADIDPDGTRSASGQVDDASYIEAAIEKSASMWEDTSDAVGNGFTTGADPQAIMQLLTGSPGTTGTTDDFGSNAALLAALTQKSAAGKMLIAFNAQPTDDALTIDGDTVIPNHAYAIMGANAKAGTVTLRNPWDTTGNDGSTFTVSVATFTKLFPGMCYQN